MKLFCVAGPKWYLVTASSFQIGYRFNYWEEKEGDELYIKERHKSFKQEILEYGYLHIEDYNNILILLLHLLEIFTSYSTE